jgi:hypothetical protein
MKAAMWGVGMILIGLTGVVFLMLFENVTSSNEQNYYLLREVTEAAMTDAVDIGYYRETGVIKINKEKFVENFVRRFAETANIQRTYKIKVYDVIETPPKVSLQVGTSAYITFTGKDFNIINNIDAILETKK